MVHRLSRADDSATNTMIILWQRHYASGAFTLRGRMRLNAANPFTSKH
jgi:hypothetical protein